MSLASQLGATFLFESLSEAQLERLAALGTEVAFDADDIVFVGGEPAEYLWVLLSGEMELVRDVGGQRIHLTTASRPGTYAGGIRAFSGSSVASGYRATGRATQASRFFCLPSSELSRLLAEWSPVAKHFLDGYLQRLEGIETTVRERERLISLGRMAAGLAHEVNNPAAAALRATSDLQASLGQLQGVVRWIADADLSAEQLRALVELQSSAANATPPAARGALELANAEEEVGSWLDARSVDNAWDLATIITAAGLDVDWLEQSTRALRSGDVGPGLNWVAATLGATTLLNQAEEALGRVVRLVSAVKEYSYMDRAPVQEIDVHDGIEKTLIVLDFKLRSGVEVVREYDADLPRILADGAALNQVWTNLIDNAIDAIDSHGPILIRTRRQADYVVVEIEDHGRGIPSDQVSRIFDPFYTTKEPGKGTGVGLDIVRRVVVDGHRGEVSVDSQPGRTRFIVRLPIAS